MATLPQRVYRALCPNCGAAVEFASAASASAVCSYCRSTLVRDGDALRRIGVSAELFDDHTPLQLGARGSRQGVAFTLVGRLQYGHAGGTWNEWHALFDNGRSAWLSEDNGAYVFAFDAPWPGDAPAIGSVRAGQHVSADGRAWDVASVVAAHLIAAEGELPAPPRLDGEFAIVDLRNPAGEVATLDAADPARPAWSVGRSVLLAELALQGLKDGSEKTLGARGAPCPNCGAALEIKLATTQSVTCTQCNAVVDVSQGVGAEMAHYQQNNEQNNAQNNGQNNAGAGRLAPRLALGSGGTLALGGPSLPWQVVGFMARCDVPLDGDETVCWREYLLYHREAGFAFLVDAEDGWSWVRPITGAPAQRQGGVEWQGDRYRPLAAYAARVAWVQGEFYWRVERDEVAQVADYAGTGTAAARRLSEERSGSEVTWSAGQTLTAAEVAAAFGLPAGGSSALQRDVAPVAFGGGMLRKALVVVVALIVLVVLLSTCSRDDCAEVRSTFGAASTELQQCLRSGGTGAGVRTGGGSYGGYSSGGGHK